MQIDLSLLYPLFNLLVSFLKLLETGIWDDPSQYMNRILPKDVSEAAMCNRSSSSVSSSPPSSLFQDPFGIELTLQLDQRFFLRKLLFPQFIHLPLTIFFVLLFVFVVEPYSWGIILGTAVIGVKIMFKLLTFMELTLKPIKQIRKKFGLI